MTYALVLLAASLTAQADVAPTSDPALVAPVTAESPAVSQPARAPLSDGTMAPATDATAAPATDPAASAPPADAPVVPAPATPATAQGPAATVAAQTPPAKPQPSFTRFGLMLDAGVPDGFGASVAIRPIKELRLHFGGITTTSAFGLRAGVAYVPFHFWVTPSATVELGRMFEGTTGFLNTFSGGAATQLTDSLVRRFSYTFVNGHLGLELGSPDSFQFFLKAGLSYVDLEAADFQDRFREQINDPTVTAQPAHLRYSGPSAKLGFVFYFL